MAKIGFTKLGLKSNNEIQTFKFNEQVVEVKQYLPVEKKLELITNVLQSAHDENNFSNPIKVKVFTILEIIENYTNITFTEKQKQNPTKIYDLIIGNGLADMVINNIPQNEYEGLIMAINKTIEAVYTYQNSVLGLLEAITTDYETLNFDATTIQKKLNDPNTLGLLKDVMSKLG